MIEHVLQVVGRPFLQLAIYLGQLTQLFGEICTSFVAGRIRPKLIGRQLVAIGFGSQSVVIVTGAFTGAVFAAQSYFKFNDFGVGSSVGAVVAVAMSRELGPVLTGLMVSGRVGASMAAEIGTMKVTQQVDALRAMGIHPIDWLVQPRAVAILISMPLLTAESIAFGMFASHVTAVHGFHIPEAWYLRHVALHTDLADIAIGMIKGLVFGMIILLVSCHQGLNASNGAVGVGKGTTSAVVISCLLILIFNFFLTLLLNYFFPL